jgi:hypothetical protein
VTTPQVVPVWLASRGSSVPRSRERESGGRSPFSFLGRAAGCYRSASLVAFENATPASPSPSSPPAPRPSSAVQEEAEGIRWENIRSGEGAAGAGDKKVRRCWKPPWRTSGPFPRSRRRRRQAVLAAEGAGRGGAQCPAPRQQRRGCLGRLRLCRVAPRLAASRSLLARVLSGALGRLEGGSQSDSYFPERRLLGDSDGDESRHRRSARRSCVYSIPPKEGQAPVVGRQIESEQGAAGGKEGGATRGRTRMRTRTASLLLPPRPALSLLEGNAKTTGTVMTEWRLDNNRSCTAPVPAGRGQPAAGRTGRARQASRSSRKRSVTVSK